MRAAIAATLLIGLALPAWAGDQICINTFDVDHTDIPNDFTIVFHMKDHAVYRNDMTVRCPTLAHAEGGFIYQPTDPATGALCDGMAAFRVNNGTGNGPVCQFGNFTRVK